MSDYNYDEQGQFFPYFVLTIAGLVALPTTYSVLKPSKELENTASRIESDFKPEHEDLIDQQRRAQKRKQLKTKRIYTAVLMWGLMGYMAYLIAVTARTIPKIWDPYDVLGVSRSATEKQIKSHYRRLSLTYHPDKATPDSAKNETIDTINERWVEMTKAFKTLTDEEVRNNYLQFGHPDGKQSFSIGIALPKWLVAEGAGKYVLLVYAALLGILLPLIVSRWWYGQQKQTKEKILVASAGNLFQEYKPDLKEGGVISAISTGEEYKVILKGEKADNGVAKLEQSILAPGALSSTVAGLKARDKQTLEELDDGARRKALALIWAYLGRVELQDPTLNSEKLEVAPIARDLNEAFVSISLAYQFVEPLLSAYHASQSLIQAVAPGESPLLQLPFFTREIVQAAEGANSRTHMSVQEFMRLAGAERQKLCTGPKLLTSQQYKTAVSVASQLPFLKVERAFFKVVGERFITPSSLVQFVVKARFVPPGSTKLPEINPKDLEDVDPVEGDLAALRKKDGQTGDAGKPIQPPLANAPYFARDHSPRWHVMLADSKQGKIVVPPFTFSTFDKPLFDDAGKPTMNIQTLKMQFGAPPQAGKYTFVMHLICDSYIGMDTKQEVVLEVEEASKAAQIEEEEDISEPEEDSLAGQMQALKPGGAAPRKKKAVADDDDDDESGTEEEDDESDTDTDTDTDEE